MGGGGIDGYVLQGDGGLGSPRVPDVWLQHRGAGRRCAEYRLGSILVVSPDLFSWPWGRARSYRRATRRLIGEAAGRLSHPWFGTLVGTTVAAAGFSSTRSVSEGVDVDS